MDKLAQWLTVLANIGVLVGIIFLAVEIQQNTHGLEMNRQIALAEAYATRNNTIQDAYVEAALSPDFGEIYMKWQKGGSDVLTEAERFRVINWESARIFRIESQFVMWEQGLLEEDMINGLRFITRRSVAGWRDLDILWIPAGRYRAEIDRAIREIDESQ